MINIITECQKVENVHFEFRILYIYNSSLFTVNNKTFEGTARIVEQDNDPKLAAEVQNLMSIKYGANDRLILMYN